MASCSSDGAAQDAENDRFSKKRDKAQWSYSALMGRLVEVSGRGAKSALTAAAGLILEAQLESEPVAWIRGNCNGGASTFFAPDFAANGIDLNALAVVRAPENDRGGRKAARIADCLLRSGAFGLLVLDLGDRGVLPMAAQGRLVGLAKRHDTLVLCLTEKSVSQPSLGSMVSMRAEALRITEGPGRFRCKMSVVKDKKRGPGWQKSEVVRAPSGMH